EQLPVHLEQGASFNEKIYDLAELFAEIEVDPKPDLSIWGSFDLQDNPIFDMEEESDPQSKFNIWVNPIFGMKEESGPQSESDIWEPVNLGAASMQSSQAHRGTLPAQVQPTALNHFPFPSDHGLTLFSPKPGPILPSEHASYPSAPFLSSPSEHICH